MKNKKKILVIPNLVFSRTNFDLNNTSAVIQLEIFSKTAIKYNSFSVNKTTFGRIKKT